MTEVIKHSGKGGSDEMICCHTSWGWAKVEVGLGLGCRPLSAYGHGWGRGQVVTCLCFCDLGRRPTDHFIAARSDQEWSWHQRPEMSILWFSSSGTLPPEIEVNFCSKQEVRVSRLWDSLNFLNESILLWHLNVLICKMGLCVMTPRPGNPVRKAMC